MQSVRTVELNRGPGGFGFTLSSQGPCVLSCILASSPAHKAGLRPGDQILYVNGDSVERFPHEQVVKSIARSPDGRVNLGVRNRVDRISAAKQATDISTPEDHETPEEAAVNSAILNRVDKVVEELKSGQLFVNTPAAFRRSLPSTNNEEIISEDEIVSDEELKASFSENCRPESSSDSVFAENNFTNTRRSSEGDGLPGFATTKLNRVLYPALTPARSAPNSSSQSQSIEPELRSVVGYLGSIELPASSSLQSASLNAIRGCVRRLRAQQKVHVVFMLEVSVVGVRLIDSGGITIVTYPIKSLAFTGICSDDNKVFGIVTRKSSEGNRTNSWHTSSHLRSDEQNTVNCSCHVFAVDTELVPHEVHCSTAEKFHMKCTPASDSECKEFLSSSSLILQAISGLFKERTGSESGTDHDGILTRSSSSQSESDTTVNWIGHPVSVPQSLSDSGHVLPSAAEADQLDVVNEKSHKIRVRVIDGVDIGLKSEILKSEVVEEPFRHRTVQIQRVSPLVERKGSGNRVGWQEKGTEQCHSERDHNNTNVMSNSYQPANQDPNMYESNCNYEGHFVNSMGNNTSPPSTSPDSSPDSALSLGSQMSCQSELDSKTAVNINWVDSKPYDLISHSTEPSLSQSVESLNHSDVVLPSGKRSKLSPSISSSNHSIHSIGSMPGNMSSMDGRVARWALGFDKLMEDPAGLRCFEEILKKEFSEENIVFWIACEDFRCITDPKELKIAAANIFDTHLSPHATMPVNIDSSAVKLAEEHLANPVGDMYRLQQQQVYTLMKFDSYPRFLKSDLYRQCIMAEIEGLSLPFEDESDEKGNKSKLVKKGNYLSPSSEESENSSSSSRSSFSFEVKRPGHGWGRRSSKKSTNSMDESKTPGEKMRSLLPWKGKQAKKGSRPFGSQPSSARSSMSSLSDSLQNISYSLESLEARRDSEPLPFCRIVLPDHSSTILTAKQGQTLLESLTHLCERRHMSLASMEVYLGNTDKPAQPKHLDVDMFTMSSREVYLKHRSLFRLELPNGHILGVKTKPDQSIHSCIKPILRRHGFEYSTVTVHLAGCEVPLDSGIPVASIEHQDVVVEINKQFTGHNMIPSRNLNKPPLGFSTAPRRGSSRRGSGWDDSIFDDIVRGKKQSLGNGYFDDTGVWVPGLKPFRSQESLGDGSFGKSFLKGAGLFSRKRKEVSENEKTVTVKSGRSRSQKSSEVRELFDLLSRAQGKRMDDQRGELGKENVELPEFLRLPTNTAQDSHSQKEHPPPAPPPPPKSGSVKVKGNTRPVVRKTVSSPAIASEQVNFMNELTARLARRSESDSDPAPISEKPEGNEEDNEVRSTGPVPSTKEEAFSPWEPRRISDHRRINVVRPRACTDGAVFRVEAVTPVRLDREFSIHPRSHLLHSESEPNMAPTRIHNPQPLTVNSIRGLYTSTGNIRQQGSMERSVIPVRPHHMQKYTSQTTHRNTARDISHNTPYVYEAPSSNNNQSSYVHEAPPSGNNESSERLRDGSRSTGKIRDISGADMETERVKDTGAPYHFPEANAQTAEVHVPSSKAVNIPRSRYIPTVPDRRPRPKPITDPSALIAGLEVNEDSLTESRVDSSPSPERCVSPSTAGEHPPARERMLSPVLSDRSSASGSPLPPTPSPPKDSHETDIANYPPPTPLCSVDSGDHTANHHRLSRGGLERPLSLTTPSPDESMNKTITPASTNERTFVGESADDSTPYPAQKPSKDDITKRLGTKLHGDAGRANERPFVGESADDSTPYPAQKPSRDDITKRLGTKLHGDAGRASKGGSGKYIPKLDPYVTYESDDLRITFV